MFEARQCSISYGVDASRNRLIVVRTERTRRGLKEETVLDHAGPPDSSTAEALARARVEAEAARALVSACIPVHESLTRWIKTPLSSIAKARKVLPSMLDIQLPFPIESCRCEFVHVARNTAGSVDALGVAARTEDVEQRLAGLEDLGVSPDRLDHEGLALWSQSTAEMPPERDAARIVACLGAEHAALAAGRGTDYTSSHSIRIGLAELESSPDRIRQFAQRAKQVLLAQSVATGNQPLLWLWAGTGATSGIIPALQSALGEAGGIRFATHDRPAHFLARALAARSLRPDALPCNFRSGTLAHPRTALWQERQTSFTATACLAAGLLLCGMGVTWRAFLDYRRDLLQTSISTLASKLAGTSRIPKGQEILTVQRALELRAPTVTPFLQGVQPPLGSLLANLLKVARDTGMDIEALSLTDDSATLRGSSPDWDRCAGLAAPLKDAGFDVAVERQDALEDERVHFTIKGARPAGGPAS